MAFSQKQIGAWESNHAVLQRVGWLEIRRRRLVKEEETWATGPQRGKADHSTANQPLECPCRFLAIIVQTRHENLAKLAGG